MRTIILIFLFSALNALAGNEKGNGGDAVVCRNAQGKIVRSELLDYYEGRSYRQLEHQFEASLTHEEFFEKLSAKLMDFDPARFASFREESLKLLRSMQEYRSRLPQSIPGYVYSNGSLIDIPDSAHLVMPKNCAIEQLVIQVTQQYPEDPKFIIQSEILDSLSEDDFRGIILHEVLYKSFIKALWVTDSVTTRYFHQVLTSRPLDDFNFMVYITLLKEIFPVVPLWPSKQIVMRKDRILDPLSFEKIDDHLFKMDATGARYVYRNDGSIDAQKTIDTSHGFVLFTAEAKDAKDCNFPKPTILVTDSSGTTKEWYNWRTWRPGWIESREVLFGKIKFALKIPASKERGCKKTTVDVYYGDTVFISYKILPVEQSLEFNFNLGLDKDLFPEFSKLP